jgi:hypothetical protein
LCDKVAYLNTQQHCSYLLSGDNVHTSIKRLGKQQIKILIRLHVAGISGESAENWASVE